MNEVIRKINNTFDYQIKKNGNLVIDKLIFNETINFNFQDWKNIRDETYWKERDLLEKEFEQKKLLLQLIYKYKKDKSDE